MIFNSFDIADRLDEVTGKHFTPVERADFDESLSNGLTRPAIEVALQVIIREPTILPRDIDRALLRWLDGFSGDERDQLKRLIRGAEDAWYGKAYGYVERLISVLGDHIEPRVRVDHYTRCGYPHIALEVALEVAGEPDCPPTPAELISDIRAWIARFGNDAKPEWQRLIERLNRVRVISSDDIDDGNFKA